VFRLRNVRGNACPLLLSSTMLATFFFLALYMQRGLGYTAIENGLAFLPISVAVIPRADRYDPAAMAILIPDPQSATPARNLFLPQNPPTLHC
jgi:hypothetical protein